jgi:hypothetical protein
MAAAGFKRTVHGTDSNGHPGEWHLPTAEYDLSSDLKCSQVRDLAKKIGDGVKPGAWVLVTQSSDRSWSTSQITARRSA